MTTVLQVASIYLSLPYFQKKLIEHFDISFFEKDTLMAREAEWRGAINIWLVLVTTRYNICKY